MYLVTALKNIMDKKDKVHNIEIEEIYEYDIDTEIFFKAVTRFLPINPLAPVTSILISLVHPFPFLLECILML